MIKKLQYLSHITINTHLLRKSYGKTRKTLFFMHIIPKRWLYGFALPFFSYLCEQIRHDESWTNRQSSNIFSRHTIHSCFVLRSK